jgi:hypothetical protein
MVPSKTTPMCVAPPIAEALSSTAIGALIRTAWHFDEMHLTSLPHCLSEKGAQEPFESIFVFLVTSTLLDRGWSMKLSSTIFLLLFAIALTRADNQQIQQLCVNAATCLLAVRSGLSPGRKSDLQMHRTPSTFGDYRVLFVSDTGRTVSYWW